MFYTLCLIPLLPLAGGLLELLFRRRGRLAGLWATGACTAAFLAALAATPMGAAAGFSLRACWGVFAVDGLGMTLALLLTGLGAVGLAAARHHLRAEPGDRRAVLFASSAFFVAAGAWAALTDHLLHLFIAVEATTLATLLPVAFHRRASSWEAGFKYLLVNTLGLAAALVGLGILYSLAEPLLGADQALRLSALPGAGPDLPPRAAALAGALVIAGFGTKAALVPLHAWLPDAYQESPGGFSALFAGAGTKVALLALARVLVPLAAAAPALGALLAALAAVSMLAGAGLTFAQTDLRRLLAYSSVSQMGYIALAVAAGPGTGHAAAAYHMGAHGLLKAVLFLCAAWLHDLHGTADLGELGRRRHPAWLGPVFLLAGLALGGMPPLPAFWSKFAVFTAALDAGYTWAAGAAVLTSLLTMATLIWAGTRIFLQQSQEHGGEDRWVSGN